MITYYEEACDICGQPAIGIVGGISYYCAEHEDEVVDEHAREEL